MLESNQSQKLSLSARECCDTDRGRESQYITLLFSLPPFLPPFCFTSEGHGEGGMQAEDDLGYEAREVLVVGPAHEQSPAVSCVLGRLLAHPKSNRPKHNGARHLKSARRHELQSAAAAVTAEEHSTHKDLLWCFPAASSLLYRPTSLVGISTSGWRRADSAGSD